MVKNTELCKTRARPISGQKLFSRGCPLIRESTVSQMKGIYGKKQKILVKIQIDGIVLKVGFINF